MPIRPEIRRCIYFRLNGMQCGSPAMRNNTRCYYHAEIIQRRAARKVPFIKNAADLQLAVMDTIRGLLERRLTRADATATLYGLQLAQSCLVTSGFKGGLETVADSGGSLVHQLLEDLDATAELEAHAEAARVEFDYQDSEEQKALVAAYREEQKK